MSQPAETVNIIMPVKNAGSYLHDCLSSIRGQTFSFWRLIAINDHSTDDSLEILQEAVLQDDRISVFQNPGQGIIPALQAALEKCSGTYITRMDADDAMPPNRLALMVEAIDSSAPKTIVTGKVEYFGAEPVSAGYRKYEAWLNERITLKDHWPWVYRECVIASPNWLVRRSELMEMGGFDSLNYPEDYHLVLKWYEHGFIVEGLPEITLNWREHPARTSRNSEHYDQDHFFNMKIGHFIKHQLDDKKLILWGTGPKGKLTAQLLDGHEIAFEWMDLLPKEDVKQIGQQRVTHFQNIENHTSFKLLIAVYPPERERQKLDAYLAGLGFKMGIDFWYL